MIHKRYVKRYSKKGGAVKGHTQKRTELLKINVINRSYTVRVRKEGPDRRGQKGGVRKEGSERRGQKGRVRKEGPERKGQKGGAERGGPDRRGYKGGAIL